MGRHNKKGRSKYDRHVRLHHWLLHSPAWRSLKPQARAVYVELASLFNGINNGEIALSIRDACDRCNIAKGTASKSLAELEEKGFVKIKQKGHFDYKIRHATTWILTEFEYNEELPTKEFMKWGNQNLKAGTKRGTKCPSNGTDCII